jgi:anti-anti-sigma factor
MNQSMPVRRLADSMLGDAGVTLRVDLRHCTYMDSTFLGTLLYLRRTSLHHGGGDLVLISPSPQCCRLLQQMGVAECLPSLIAEEPDASAWTELPCHAEDIDTFNRNVVQAHEELANLEGDAEKAFRPVAQCLGKNPTK